MARRPSPRPLGALGEGSADPVAVRAGLDRIGETNPELLDRLQEDQLLAAAFVAVLAASRMLGQLCLSDPAAVEVLANLDAAVPLPGSEEPPDAVARWKQLDMLRIAARDLLGMDDLEVVGASLARMADEVVTRLLQTVARKGGPGLAVIAMGKLGARELNYASDIDLVLVAADGQLERATAVARGALELTSASFRVDLGLRPEGRSGPLLRTLSSYQAYWDRWAEPWELQALIKARPVAGLPDLGSAWQEAAASTLWGRRFGSEELRQIRHMKARSEEMVARRGRRDTEVKRGHGGIRDVELAVQVLQLVHGRSDPALRRPSTLAALHELGAAGYISREDSASLAASYRYLRNLEHRLQLVDGTQVHSLPENPRERDHLARVLGHRDAPGGTAVAGFEAELRRHQARVRAIHERLFFRPLLEAFAGLPGAGPPQPPRGMPEGAIPERLAAFGFSDAARTRAALGELTRGLTRSSRLMSQVLALVLGWLSEEPDPDMGLLGLRTLTDSPHRRDLLIAVFRESPEAARRLCKLLATSRLMHDLLRREPDMIAALADDAALLPHDSHELVRRAAAGLRWRAPGDATRGLLLLKEIELARVGIRDILGMAGTAETEAALSTLAEAVLEAALGALEPPVPLAIIALGRLGGAELSYASDLDLVVVFEGEGASAAAQGERSAEALLRMVNGATPAERVFRIDPRLRPEGGDGPLARSIGAYRSYYGSWAGTWERQALLRARPVAGSVGLGRAFMDVVEEHLWGVPFTEGQRRDIRRMKARIERERLPQGGDSTFHLKLGPGALADVEWTAQLLQMEHGIRAPGTLAALRALHGAGILDGAEHACLEEAYRLCEQVRNRWALMGGSPPDALPAQADRLARLARSLGVGPSELRGDYKRVTRRARRVMEKRFYGMDR